MKAIHFICRDRENLHKIGSAFESGRWDITDDEAAALVGGMIFLHEKKAQGSYFGGRITAVRMQDFPEYPHPRRAIFEFNPLEEARAVRWPEGSNVRDWTTGVIDI